jgi:hypothetical protein
VLKPTINPRTSTVEMMTISAVTTNPDSSRQSLLRTPIMRVSFETFDGRACSRSPEARQIHALVNAE